MTKLLEKPFNKPSKLPEVQQNAHAKRLLDQLDAEQEWERRFSESEDILGRLASAQLLRRAKISEALMRHEPFVSLPL